MDILVINSGSSSLRFAVFKLNGSRETQLFSGYIDRIGSSQSTITLRDQEGTVILKKQRSFTNHDAVFVQLPELLSLSDVKTFDAVGHRIVHGGLQHIQPEIITESVESLLKELIPLAPDHLPNELAAVSAIKRLYPGIKQVACFDTAFHRKMPEMAQTIALPHNQFTQNIVCYGFHGLSYEFITNQLIEKDQLSHRIIIAHLGNGASMAAIRDGVSIDTTMSFTPVGGLVMSTRSGDLDPSVVVYLQDRGMKLREVNRMINKESGLLGISGLSWDMKTLLEKMNSDSRAALAIEIFCYRIIKSAGSLAAVLGGLDKFIFTGGIGEHSPFIRKKVCEGLKFLDAGIDDEKNNNGERMISSKDSSINIQIIKTDEELMIARHTYRLIG